MVVAALRDLWATLAPIWDMRITERQNAYKSKPNLHIPQSRVSRDHESSSTNMTDYGLELNLVSAPAAAPPSSFQRRKRISRYAWDKKNRKKRGEERRQLSPAAPKSTVPGHQAPSSGAQNKGRQSQTVDGAHPVDEITDVDRKVEHQFKIKSTAVENVSGRQQSQISVSPSAAAEEGSNHHDVHVEERPDPVANDAASVRRNQATTPAISKSTKIGRVPDFPNTKSSIQPPETERQRVVHDTGRGATRSPRDAVQQRIGGTKRSAAALSSEKSGAQRKQPKELKGPVARDGVIDFTDRGGGASPKISHLTRIPKHRAPTGRAVASAGNKWWDDDDDNQEDTKEIGALEFKATRSALTTGDGGVVVDEDGGLPSTVHPNSVRPKRVDMDGEATKAMDILTSLFVDGDATGRENIRSVKNRGDNSKKSAKSAKGNGATTEEAVFTSPLASSATHEVFLGNKKDDDHSMTFETLGGDDSQEERTRPRTTPGGGWDSIGGAVTRRNRGKVHVSGKDVLSGGVPPPEHHARPRELSRRAAAKPLRSIRSVHIMAGGPGATFTALGIPTKMLHHLEGSKGDSVGGGGMGLSGPTVCQVAAIPVLLAGHNAVIKSETGSGKTLAFLLPMLCDLAALEPRVEREKGTFAIVLAPTRELSAQILEVLSRVVRPFIWLVPGSVSGGERRKSEKARLRKGVTILVCTPGRLLDHLKATKCFRRDLLRWLVLDEADRLLDMGFEKQVKEIIELLDQSARAVRLGPAGGSRSKGGDVASSAKVIRRQTVLVSATLDKGVSRLATILLSKYMRVDADKNLVEFVDESGSVKLVSGTREAPKAKAGSAGHHSADSSAKGEGNSAAPTEVFSTPRQLVQYYMTVTQKLRLPALCAFLRARAREKVVVFMSTCDAVDFHHDMFRRAVWPGDAPPTSEAATAAGGDKDIDRDGSYGEETKDGADKKRKEPEASRAADREFFGTGCLVERLHGNVPQGERQATYRAFSASTSGVLICTDVAARGLDLPTVDWIVQYDPPAETADYVHRVGRTARRGERGHSLLFLLPRETSYLGVLEARGLRPKPLSLEGVLCAADAGKRDARRADEQLAYELQQGLQLLVAGDKTLLGRARAAFQSHVRAYAARAPDSRAVFQVRSLHLGHVARSFALKDPPTAVKVGKRVVSRPGSVKSGSRGSPKDREGAGSIRGEKRRRDGAGGMGGGVRKLGLTKRTEAASRSEFL